MKGCSIPFPVDSDGNAQRTEGFAYNTRHFEGEPYRNWITDSRICYGACTARSRTINDSCGVILRAVNDDKGAAGGPNDDRIIRECAEGSNILCCSPQLNRTAFLSDHASSGRTSVLLTLASCLHVHSQITFGQSQIISEFDITGSTSDSTPHPKLNREFLFAKPSNDGQGPRLCHLLPRLRV